MFTDMEIGEIIFLKSNMAQNVVIQTDMKVAGAIKWNMRIKYTY